MEFIGTNFRLKTFISTNAYLLNCKKQGSLNNKKVFINKKGLEVKKIKSSSPKISLIDSVKGTSTSMYLEQAQKLAKHNNLKIESLGQINNKSVFQLSKAYGNNSKKKDGKDWDKKLLFGSKILEHDINIKINNILKFLQKGKSVKVIIEGKEDQFDRMENTFKTVESKLHNDFKLKGISKSKTSISFIIMPLVKDKNEVTVEEQAEGG